jgi:DNA replication protein DnaC
MRFVYVTNDTNDPRFGKPFPCPAGCNAEAGRRKLAEMSGLIGDQLLWDFRLAWRGGQQAAARYLQMCLATDPPAGFSLLSGGYGTGKTHMLCATVNQARAAGWTSVYTNAEQLLEHFRHAYDPKVENVTFDGLWQRVMDARVLCIDELDRYNPTAWAQAKMFQLLDDRYEAALYGGARERRLTVLATNLRPHELPESLYSRLMDSDSAVFDLWDVSDMRQQKTGLARAANTGEATNRDALQTPTPRKDKTQP